MRSSAARTLGGSVRSRPISGSAPTGRRRTPAAAAPAPSVPPAVATAAPTPPTTTKPAHERARHRYEGLRAKATSTGFAEEAAACRAKAEQLRAKYGL